MFDLGYWLSAIGYQPSLFSPRIPRIYTNFLKILFCPLDYFFLLPLILFHLPFVFFHLFYPANYFRRSYLKTIHNSQFIIHNYICPFTISATPVTFFPPAPDCLPGNLLKSAGMSGILIGLEQKVLYDAVYPAY